MPGTLPKVYLPKIRLLAGPLERLYISKITVPAASFAKAYF
jgi:hypothetical protein